MFNSISMTQMAATIANAIGAEAPKQADRSIPMVDAFVEKTLGGKKVDRVLIYNPDCVGMWLFQKYTDLFIPVVTNTQLTVPVATVNPSWTPVCFGTMYTGVLPEVHGIQGYAKPVITVDSLFDSLPRSGKKVALVAVTNSSMAMIFQNRDVDYYLMPYDDSATNKALELIQAQGKRPGVVIKPGTPAEAVLPFLDQCAMVLVMTVEPGFGGQAFMPDMMDKVRAIRGWIHSRGLDCELEVDGGIGPVTAPVAVAAGANVLVAGSAVYKAADIPGRIRELRGQN